MAAIKSDVVIICFMIFHVSYCQRRITDGKEIAQKKPYMVYLVKGPVSQLVYDYWLCGGAIVSSDFVLTSAACVNDVDYLYVIAGYNKYVTDDKIDADPCTSHMRKKVIYTCSPKNYKLKYEELDYWSYIDIALVRVESAFDFDDQAWVTYCSYKPTSIAINYDEKYQAPGLDAMVLGWGHLKEWRKPGDESNYNQQFLTYAPTLLLNKTVCMEHYADYTNMSIVINNYMICSLGSGNINDKGETIITAAPLAKGCTTEQQKLLGFEGISCEIAAAANVEDYVDYDSLYDDTRRRMQNQTYNDSMADVNGTGFPSGNFRRHGICQNDHGGPLVTWAGAYEIIIGVASVFKVSDQSECMGPYLYTSTVCTGLFIDCVLSASEFDPDQSDVRRALCDRPASERGYETIERFISWKNHPAGPADNEREIGRSGGNNHPDPKHQHPKLVFAADKIYYAASPKNLNEPMYTANHMQFANKNQPQSLRERYPMDQKYQVNERYPAAARYPVDKSYPSNNNGAYPTKGIYPENVRNPANAANGYPANGYPGNAKYPGKEKYPGSERYPDSQRYPGNQGYQANERYPGNQGLQANERYQGNARYPVNAMTTENKKYPPHIRYPTNYRYPTNERYPTNKRYPTNERYPVTILPSTNIARINNYMMRPQRPLRDSI